MKLKYVVSHFHMKIWILTLTAFISLTLIIATCSLTSPIQKEMSNFPNPRIRTKAAQSKIFNTNANIEANNTDLLYYIISQHLVPPSPQRYNLNSSNDWFTFQQMNNMTLSDGTVQQQEQQLIKKLGLANGFFVECRAFDGLVPSHSLPLEINHNWTGLLIEPSQTLFSILKKRHRLAWLANICITVTSPKKLKHFKHNAQIEERHNLWKKQPQNSQLQFPHLPKLERSRFDYEIVECFPLQSVLMGLKVDVVDLLVLNLHGRERQIIESFPFDQIQIKVISMMSPNSTDRLLMTQLMKNKGYRLVFENSRGHIFLNSSLKFLLD